MRIFPEGTGGDSIKSYMLTTLYKYSTRERG